jgi:hypothetical protein
LLSAFGSGLICFFTAWIHFSLEGFGFAEDLTVPYLSRLERVKATTALWQLVAIYGGIGYLAFGVTWISVMWPSVEHIVKAPADRFLMGQSLLIQVVVITICVILGPLWEAFSNATLAASQLSNVCDK